MKVQNSFYSNVVLEIVMILAFLESKDSFELFKIEQEDGCAIERLKGYYANKVYFVLTLHRIL